MLSAPLLAPACADNKRPAIGFQPVQIAGHLQNRRIDEASGLARSNLNGDLLWTMNDEGPPRLYAIRKDGSDFGNIEISNAKNKDWEDLSSFVSDGTAYLLVADVGDNDHKRRSVTIYIVEEPQLTGGQDLQVRAERRLKIRFPEGPLDVEAVSVDLESKRILLISKRTIPAKVFSVPLVPVNDDVLEAEEIAELKSLPQPSEADIANAPKTKNWYWQPTALSFSANGRQAVVLTYAGVYLYERNTGESWPQAFDTRPTALGLDGYAEAESAVLDSNGSEIFVALEGRGTALLRYDRQ